MPDILLATFLFFLMVGGILSFFQNIQTSSQSGISRKTLDTTASNIAEFIIKNKGTPENWETYSDFNSIQSIGLAQKDRVLREEKVVAFVNQSNSNYEQVKNKLNITNYDFYASFEGGATISAGVFPPSNASVSVVRRLVTINGIETKFTFILYEE